MSGAYYTPEMRVTASVRESAYAYAIALYSIMMAVMA
jgi:hypothetical protein